MKKFNVPTQMDTVLKVISKKYRIHFKRRKGCYIAEWELSTGVRWALCYSPNTGKMCATIVWVADYKLHLNVSRPSYKGYSDCMELAHRLLTRTAV
jgi:hypothetical protein